MSKRSHVAIGPGSASLILIIVAVSMSVLGTLTLISSRNDYKLSASSVAVAQTNYTLYDRSERTLCTLMETARTLGENASEEDWTAAMPENTTFEDGALTWCEEENGRCLHCSARVIWENGAPRAEWTEHRMSRVGESEEEDLEIWD